MKATASNTLDYLGNWNPQFLREVKGKLKPKNIITTVAVSLIAQFLIVIAYLSELPDSIYQAVETYSVKAYALAEQYSRYCVGDIIKPNSYRYKPLLCHQDMHDNWVINWQIFGFDIFVTISVIGIALLLVFGTYFLINNAIAETKQETLNLVRLSPQSASNIFLGKILGVPILLYLGLAAALPLHLFTALQATIPLSLLFLFYLAVIASCGFFYSLGLLLSFLRPKSITAWIVMVAIAFFLFASTLLSTYITKANSETLLDWLFIFNPNNLILYLGKAAHIPHHYFDYYTFFSIFGRASYKRSISEPFFFSHVLFYGQTLGTKIWLAMSLVIGNLCLWTYWLWQGLKRRYYNPENTLITKQQSYWLTGSFIAISLGFSLQNADRYFLGNMALLQFVTLALFITLIFALSPQRQTLHDWARYRHQMKQKGNVLWRELVFGDKSPSTVAIAINLSIVALYLAPSLVIFSHNKEVSSVLWSSILILGTILFYAAIAQLILLSKSKHRANTASVAVTSLIIAPPIFLNLFGFAAYKAPVVWLLTSFPWIVIEKVGLSSIIWTIWGQWLAIALVSLQITRKLRQAGKSDFLLEKQK